MAAKYTHIIPFIKEKEGGLSKDTSDAASANPVPDGSGFHTNKGFTWLVWSGQFGTGEDSVQRFYKMSDEDWGTLFKKLYWDLVCGDQINSQRIADVLADWCFNAGRRTPSIDVQDILNHAFAQHLTEDGQLGSSSIAVINSVDENTLFNDIVQKRLAFYDLCVASHPSNAKYLVGWKGRVNTLVSFEQSA